MFIRELKLNRELTLTSSQRDKQVRRIGNYSEDAIYDVARDYYENELTQDTIAKKYKTTRTDVSFMLRAASQLGIVTITVKPPPHRRAEDDAKAKLHVAYPFLRHVHTINTPRAIVAEVAERTGNPALPYTQGVAEKLHASLNDSLDWQLAVGAGATVRQVLKRLAVLCAEDMRFPMVVPAVGWFVNESTHNALQNAEYFLAKVRDAEGSSEGSAEADLLPPLVAFALSSERDKRHLEAVEPVKRALDALKNVQHIFLRVGPYSVTEHRRLSSVRRDWVNKVACNLSGYVIYEDGVPLDEEDQPFGIGIQRLKELVDSGKAEVVLAGRKGADDNRDALAVRAALRGHLGNVLIIDRSLAEDINEIDLP